MSLRQHILESINQYRSTWAHTPNATPPSLIPFFNSAPEDDELGVSQRFLEFILSTPECFSRSTTSGHFTGSALVVNDSLTSVLLTHHKKLGMWLQLGGHADGHHLLHEVAMTEACEESGLMNLSFLDNSAIGLSATGDKAAPAPFDIDFHVIPANRKDQEHLHFDVRYVVVAKAESLPIVSDESHDVRWFTLDEARTLNKQRSMLRQFDKIDWLRAQQFATLGGGTSLCPSSICPSSTT
jgi:8-oxo-dGTP pyrophosphatase MutT (NUDIX family)